MASPSCSKTAFAISAAKSFLSLQPFLPTGLPDTPLGHGVRFAVLFRLFSSLPGATGGRDKRGELVPFSASFLEAIASIVWLVCGCPRRQMLSQHDVWTRSEKKGKVF